MFVDILAIILIIVLSFIFCINDNNYKCQLSHIIIGLTVIVFYKLYKCIILNNATAKATANINMLNIATVKDINNPKAIATTATTTTNCNYSTIFNHPKINENFVSSNSIDELNEFISSDLTSSISMDDTQIKSMSSTQHKEYINKIDALITALNKINTTTQNSTQANANIATDLPIDKLDLETQQQFQMFQINYMNKQIQNAKDILNAQKVSSSSSNYKPLKVYGSCVIANADGTTSIDTPVKSPFTNQQEPSANKNMLQTISQSSDTQFNSQLSGQASSSGQILKPMLDALLKSPQINVNIK